MDADDRQYRLRAAAGTALGYYMRLVRRTTRFVRDPQDYLAAYGEDMPVIFTSWHEDNYFFFFVRDLRHRVAGLASRSRDGEVAAAMMRMSGLELIRGSGGRSRKATLEKGGIKAFLAMRRKLAEGVSVAQTANVPHKGPRRCGDGVIKLAQLSGRPIVPCGFAFRSLALKNDKEATRVPLPWGRAAIILGPPIYVPRDTDAEGIEAFRQEVEASLFRMREKADAALNRPD